LTFKNKKNKKSQLLQKIQRSLDKIPDLATLNPLPVAAPPRQASEFGGAFEGQTHILGGKI
jgi:hypothetical protein